MDLVAAMIFPEIRPTTRGRKFIRERERGKKVGGIEITGFRGRFFWAMVIKVAREIDQWLLFLGESRCHWEFFTGSPGAREGIVSFVFE